MMLIIFHGENPQVSGKKIDEIKSGFPKEAISYISLKGLSVDQLIMALATPSLFVERRLVIVDDIDEKKFDLAKIPDDDDLTLVLRFGRELGAASTVLKEANKRKAVIWTFSQPQDKSVFLFLDLIAEKNSKALENFESLYNQFGGQYLLTMFLYLMRRMVLPSRRETFGAAKLEKQKKNFLGDQIANCYEKILETDFAIKSGKRDEKTALLLLVNYFIT